MLPFLPLLVPLLLDPCDSTALKRPVGTSIDTLRLMVRGGAGLTRLPRPWVDVLLDELSTRLALPSPLPLPVFGGFGKTGPADQHHARPTVANEVRLTFRADHRLADARISTRSLSDPADLALLGAVRRADSAGTLPPLPDDVRQPEQVTVFVALTTQSRPDEIRPRIDQVGRDVTVLRVPVYDEATAVQKRPEMRGARFPREELQANHEGDVTLHFVVDETGAVAPGTRRVLSFTSEAFARSVFAFLDSVRYYPATVGACPVKQLVSQPFQFRIEPSRVRILPR